MTISLFYSEIMVLLTRESAWNMTLEEDTIRAFEGLVLIFLLRSDICRRRRRHESMQEFAGNHAGIDHHRLIGKEFAMLLCRLPSMDLQTRSRPPTDVSSVRPKECCDLAVTALSPSCEYSDSGIPDQKKYLSYTRWDGR
jgi:hypothetical protein